MTDAEPQVVTAIRSALAGRLGLDVDKIEAQERRAPGSSDDEPFYLTLRVPQKEGLDDATIDAALDAVQAMKWSHPAYHTQLRWEYKS